MRHWLRLKWAVWVRDLSLRRALRGSHTAHFWLAERARRVRDLELRRG